MYHKLQGKLEDALALFELGSDQALGYPGEAAAVFGDSHRPIRSLNTQRMHGHGLRALLRLLGQNTLQDR